MHGGVKFYRGSPGAARTYVEADRSRVDDYYLAEGTGLATRYVAGTTTETTTETIDGQELRGERGEERGPVAVRHAGMLDGDA